VEPISTNGAVLRINLAGPFIVQRSCPAWSSRTTADRHIASIAGKEATRTRRTTGRQGRLIALTKSLGKELAGYEIAVNAVTLRRPNRVFDQLTQHISTSCFEDPRTLRPGGKLAAMWRGCVEDSVSTGAVFDISGPPAT